MPTAEELYRTIIFQLEKIKSDCAKFDEKENLEAGIRIRTRLRKVKKKIDFMIKETLKTTDMIKEKRGIKPFSSYYQQYKSDGRWSKKYVKKSQVKKL